MAEEEGHTRLHTVLVIAGDQTRGLRRDSNQLIDCLRQCGMRVEAVRPSFRWVKRLLFAYPMIDLLEAASIALAAFRWLQHNSHVRIDAIFVTTAPAVIFMPKRWLRISAVRFDSLAQENRHGWRNSPTRWLERRRIGGARLLLPYSRASAERVRPLVGAQKPIIVWPPPIESTLGPDRVADRNGFLCYAADPWKKGLDIAVGAFSMLASAEDPLFVAGISETEARRYLNTRDVVCPDSVRFVGSLTSDEYRDLSRRCHAYLGSSRHEEYGTSQLEALADGALLITVPSGGPSIPEQYARQLDPALVASSVGIEALFESMRASKQYSLEDRQRYSARARELMADLTYRTFVRRLRMEILPLLATSDEEAL